MSNTKHTPEDKKEINVSECCGKHGFILKYDGILSGTNFYDAEKEGICPVCEQPAKFIPPSEKATS